MAPVKNGRKTEKKNLFGKGNRGRPKGATNKATREHKDWLNSVLDGAKYRAMFERKLCRGTLPPNIWQDAINRAKGKVPTTVNLGGSVLEKLLAQGEPKVEVPHA
jgi:hypothetical protein